MSKGKGSKQSDAATLRVLLAGKSERARRLRKDPRIELRRASEALDAVGELAAPLEPDTPGADAIVVCPGVIDGAEQREFTASLRRIAPEARLIALASDNGSVWPAEDDRQLYDAVVDGNIDGDRLRKILADMASEQPKSQASTMKNEDSAWWVAHEQPPAPPTDAAPLTSSSLTLPDAGVVRAMLAGGAVLESCIDILRQSFSDPELAYYEADRAPSPAPPRRAVRVSHRGKTFGWLTGHADAASLEQAAEWLACWLALHEQREQLRREAFTDPLTGVFNRRHFDRYLPSALDHARQRRHELSLLLFDIDNFKRFNDRHGHPAGDEILREAVRLLRSVIRPADRVCRVGGDEFAVIFYEPDGPRNPGARRTLTISQIIERFQEQIRQQRFPLLGADAPGVLTISGGLATFPWDALTADELIQRADELALESKRLGKNRVTFGPRPTDAP